MAAPVCLLQALGRPWGDNGRERGRGAAPGWSDIGVTQAEGAASTPMGNTG